MDIISSNQHKYEDESVVIYIYFYTIFHYTSFLNNV